MSGSVSKRFKLEVSSIGAVTATTDAPAAARPGAPGLVLAHGANNDLDYPLLAYLAENLATTVGATVIRFNFPYVERGAQSSSDSVDTLLETFRTAYRYLVHEALPADAPVFVGGKSLGGRTAAELVSRRPDSDGLTASGLVELGYPLHAPGRSDRVNVAPLRHIDIPSLFCVGSHDAFCDLELFRPVLATLLTPPELYVVEKGDHSLLLPHSSGKASDGAYADVLAKVAELLTSRSGGSGLRGQ